MYVYIIKGCTFIKKKYTRITNLLYKRYKLNSESSLLIIKLKCLE